MGRGIGDLKMAARSREEVSKVGKFRVMKCTCKFVLYIHLYIYVYIHMCVTCVRM